ncbi:hypothetical protein [Umezawaea sp. Da 62-37]|uniref:hypothetical protein n=1 Tax=Umezawaea sp. Da 62-37 TaxID=3075927 RepID=UPI0028F72CC9|nr:hypothetical protein [Umezawaea sp. Da 62-37]WNV87492.1 hypothetical protein RM788_04085 [Umezawaea sp. Da 62-37]
MAAVEDVGQRTPQVTESERDPAVLGEHEGARDHGVRFRAFEDGVQPRGIAVSESAADRNMPVAQSPPPVVMASNCAATC